MNYRRSQKPESYLLLARVLNALLISRAVVAARFFLIAGFCFCFAGCSLLDSDSKSYPMGTKKSSTATKSEKSDKKPAVKKSNAKEDIPTAPIGLQ
jgi:hypothetical protein